MRKPLFILLVVIAAVVSVVISCKKNSDSPTTPFKLRLTDFPSPLYDSVIIDLQSVEVTQATSKKTTVVLNVNKGLYNLLDFTNGKDTLIASATLPTTMILQVRLILGPNNYLVIGGVQYPLQTPSAEQSGLKLNVHTTLLAGVEYIMTLDFDATRSIVTTGNGDYILKPVIRVITTAASGSIKGSAGPAAALPAIVMAVNTPDTFSTITDAAGQFLISGVPAGTYNVTLTPSGLYSPFTQNGVVVTVGAITDIGAITF